MKKTEPLFVRFSNKDLNTLDLIDSFSSLEDPVSKEAIKIALENIPDLEDFRKEIFEAVTDIVKEGIGEEFIAFVNHYMENSLEELIEKKGENLSRTAKVKDPNSNWLQGFVCYNLCLYIKTFGLSELKSCKMCGRIFSIKGKYAIYCSDDCKLNKNKKKDNSNESSSSQF